MINSVTIIGRLTRDPEYRQAPESTAIAVCTVAVDRDKDNTDFIPVIAFGELANNVCKYVKKGHLVGILGRISQRSFVRQDGTKGQSIEVIAQTVDFLEKKPEENEKPKAKKKA